MTFPLIRLAGSDDAEHLASLRRDYGTERHPQSESDPDFDHRFSEWHQRTQDSCVTWLAMAEAQPAGILSMFVFPRMPMPGRHVGQLAYLSLLFVTPDHRNKGLGRRLLEAAFAYSHANDIFKILLRPTEQALSLYSRAGFRTADQYVVWSSADQVRP